MIKASVVFLNFVALLFFSLFNDAEILIDNNTPATIAPGEKQEVQLTVNKGDVQGFSKLEIALPFGFSASPGDIKGASFTFSGQKAKFLWMTLPTEENFTITYFIESADNLEGNYDITGTFSYVKENKREDISIPTKTLNVKKVIGPTPQEVAETMPGVKIEETVNDMICERTITKINDLEYSVKLEVRNNAIKGLFGRILETLPMDCKSNVVNDGGATVTQQSNTIKFVWFGVPDTDSFECSYKILCSNIVDMPAITGVFTYSLNFVPYDVAVVNKGGVAAEPVAQTDTTNNSNSNNTNDNNTTTAGNDNLTTTNNTSENNANTNNNTTTEVSNTASNTANNTTTNTTETETTANSNNATTPLTSVPSAENGITYKVQILAAHRVVNKTFMKKTYNFTQSYNIENVDGWVKYTTGKYTEYVDARNAREELKANHSNLPGPFVTAYNDGERITVQEALLISQQQWFK
jgi:hypothetical protein